MAQMKAIKASQTMMVIANPSIATGDCRQSIYQLACQYPPYIRSLLSGKCRQPHKASHLVLAHFRTS